MLVATVSFSPKRGLSVQFCVDFNHFKSIFTSALLHRTTLKILVSGQLEAALLHAINVNVNYSS